MITFSFFFFSFFFQDFLGFIFFFGGGGWGIVKGSYPFLSQLSGYRFSTQCSRDIAGDIYSSA